jgi:hypothetical protein
MGLPIPNLGRKSKHVSQNCIKKSLFQILPLTKLTNLQKKLIANVERIALSSHLSQMIL